MAYRIVICDDNAHVRAFLGIILSQAQGMHVVAEGVSGRDAVALCRSQQPDLLLVDVQMETDHDGIEAIAQIRQFDTSVKIIVLTVYSDDDFIIEAFQSGADNFIMKDLSPGEILQNISETLAGNARLSQLVAGKLKNYVARSGQTQRDREEKRRRAVKILSSLTRTELEILQLVRQGYTREEISHKKYIELGTVKTHINRLLKKLSCKRTAEAIHMLEDIGFFDYVDSLENEEEE